MIYSFEVIPFYEKRSKVSSYSFRKFFFGIKKLSTYNPKFFSVTFSSRINFKQTLKICLFIKKCGFDSVPHLSCNLNVDKVKKYCNILFNNKILQIFPLRGNICNTKFKYSLKLIDLLTEEKKFDFFSSGYPEGHPEEKKYNNNINILKKKCYKSIGIFTQFFMGFDIYYNFIKKIIEKGFLPRIYIGIMNICNIKFLYKISKVCKFSIPLFYKKNINSMNDYICYLIFFIKTIKNFYRPFCIHIYTMNKFKILEYLLKKIK
ncbi:methylenetetrahydrofolate reductase [Candidatus Vidania fulgoroideorum]